MDQRCTVSAAAVLFDLDGVLVDSTSAVEGHWRGFATRHGLDQDALLADEDLVVLAIDCALHG